MGVWDSEEAGVASFDFLQPETIRAAARRAVVVSFKYSSFKGRSFVSGYVGATCDWGVSTGAVGSDFIRRALSHISMSMAMGPIQNKA